MKRLNELIKCKYNIPIYGIKTNSKKIKKGDLFIAVHGYNCDHHAFISEAVANGASAIISEKKVDVDVPVIIVKDTNKTLEEICLKFYNHIEKKFRFIGITGTDGKTTTSTIIYNILKDELNCCNIGTNGLEYQQMFFKLNNTTPEMEELYNFLSILSQAGCKTVSMEVSSEALLHRRVDKFNYDVAILTNITEDHLNIHKNIDNYVNAKAKLFKKVKKNGICILNYDDKHAEEIRKVSRGKIYTYGKSSNCDFAICHIKCKDMSTHFDILHKNTSYHITTNLVGEYNAYNITAAFACALILGLPPRTIIKRIKSINTINGRFEQLDFGQNFTIILDYAHTENGVKNILSTLKKLKHNKIITVIGSAGGREKQKRSAMGKITSQLSDHVIFTMDDPRNENVSDIISDLTKLIEKNNYEKEENRENAIKKSLTMAKAGDVVAILGKGRDEYMAIKDKKVYYSDYEVIKNFFQDNEKH